MIFDRTGKMGSRFKACFSRSRRIHPKPTPFSIKEERVSSSTFGHRRKTPEISVHFWPRERPRPGPDAIFGRSGKESSRRNSVFDRSGKAVLPGDAVSGRSGSRITREKASKAAFEVEWKQNHGVVGITFTPQRPPSADYHQPSQRPITSPKTRTRLYTIGLQKAPRRPPKPADPTRLRVRRAVRRRAAQRRLSPARSRRRPPWRWPASTDIPAVARNQAPPTG